MLDSTTLQSFSLLTYNLYLTSFHKGSKMAYPKNEALHEIGKLKIFQG